MSDSWSQWFIRLISLARELVLDGVDAMTAAVGVATKRHMSKIRMATIEAARLELQKQLKSAQDEKGEGDVPKTTADLAVVIKTVESQLSMVTAGSSENEPPATKETGDLDAMTKQARSKIQKICQEIRRVHKEEEARGLYELVEAKVAEGERWFERLNSVRTGTKPPASSEEWKKVMNQWSDSREKRVAGVQEQLQKATNMAQSAAKSSEDAQKEWAKVQAEMDEVAAKLKNQQDAMEHSKKESASRHDEAKQAAKNMVTSGVVDLEELKRRVLPAGHVWVWAEDDDRFKYHPLDQRVGTQHHILFQQDAWTTCEARFLLLENGASGDWGNFQVDVGAKLFHAHTGSRYAISLKEKQQRNLSTGFIRTIVRVPLDQSERLQREMRQQLHEKASLLEEAQRKVAAQLQKQARQVQRVERLKSEADALQKGLEPIAEDLAIAYPKGEKVGDAAMPIFWDPAAIGKGMYCEIDLKPGSTEYESILSLCKRTAPKASVLRVKRIQNVALWYLYSNRRRQRGLANEQLLFHGAKNVVDKILMSGFDRRFARSLTGTLWFSETAGYSLNSFTSRGDKRLILARVALGQVGKDSQHCGDNRYTVTDDLQAYPCYTIQFA